MNSPNAVLNTRTVHSLYLYISKIYKKIINVTNCYYNIWSKAENIWHDEKQLYKNLSMKLRTWHNNNRNV